MPIIRVSGLTKEFRTPKREPGLMPFVLVALAYLLWREGLARYQSTGH